MARIAGMPMAKPAQTGEDGHGFIRSAADSGLALGSGVVTGVKLISDAFGADNPVSRALGGVGQGMQGLLSEQRKAEMQERARLIAAAEKSGSTLEEIKAYVGGFAEAPFDTALNVLGTAAPTMASMLIPGAREANIARALGVGTGAVQGAGAGKSAIYDAVLQQKLQEGMPEEEARAIADAAQAYGGGNTDTILANTALGAVAGGSGLESAARALRYGKAAQSAAPGLIRRVGTGAVVEGVPEAGQGGMEKASANIALQREGYDVPTMQGVAGSAALEGVAGGSLGGIAAIPEASAPAGAVPVVEAPPSDTPTPSPIVPVTGPLTKAVNAGGGPIANAASQASANAAQEASLDPAKEDKTADFGAVVQLGEQAGATGAPRIPPADFSPEEKQAWRAAWDAGRDRRFAPDPAEGPTTSAGATDYLPDTFVQDGNGIDFEPTNAANTDGLALEGGRKPTKATKKGDDLELEPLPGDGPVPVRQKSDGVSLSALGKLNPRGGIGALGDPVEGYVRQRMNDGTMAGRAFASDYKAGRITRKDVEKLLQDDAAKAQARIDTAAASAKKDDPTKLVVAQESRARPKGEAATGPAFASLDEADDYVTAQFKRNGTVAGVPIETDGGIAIVAKSDPRYAQGVQNRKSRLQARKEAKRADTATPSGAGTTDRGTVSGDSGVVEQPAIEQGSSGTDAAGALDGTQQRDPAGEAGRAGSSDALNPSMVAATRPQPKTTGPQPINAQPAGTRGTTAADILKPVQQPVQDQGATTAPEGAGASQPTPAQAAPDYTEAEAEWTRMPMADRLAIAKRAGWSKFANKAWSEMKDAQRASIAQAIAARYAPNAKADKGTGTQTQAPADQTGTPAGSVGAAGATGNAVDTRAGSAEVEADGLTAKIERAKRRLRENRNKQATTGVREELTKLKAQEQDIEREIRSLRQQAMADEPATAPEQSAPKAPATDQAEAVTEQNKPDKDGNRIIGRRKDGVMIREDKRGVRWYAKDGARIFETVEMRPTRQGVQIARGVLKPEFMTAKESDDEVSNSPAPAPAPSANTVFTEDAAEKARAILRAKLGGGNKQRGGIDPEVFTAGLTLAGYHIEKGARKFAAYAKAMVEDLGDVVKPYLKSWYMGVKYDPRGAGMEGMDSAADVEAADVDALLADSGDAGVAPEPGQDNNQPKEGSPDEQVRQPNVGPQDQAGSRQAKGGRESPAQQDDARRDSGDLGAAQPDDVAPTRAGESSRPAGDGAASPDVGPEARTDEVGDAGNRRPRSGGARTSDAGAGGRSGKRPARKPEPVDPETVSPANDGPGDFVMADPLKVVGGGQVARFEKNKAAIELRNRLIDEGRKPTREEQEVLAGYTGWGSFGQELFQGNWRKGAPKPGWEARDQWLREQLGESEWEGMQNSIINAHYTDPPTVMAMWDMTKRLGFQGGRVLEPSIGIGNFFAMMPPELTARSQRAGIELDPVTGSMAQLLYPKANIQIKGYEESTTPDNFYDLVIGNWPFFEQGPADRRYNRLNPTLHDYFFLKALDQAKPGGLVVGITTHGTMDKKGVNARMEMARKGELVAAFRLPTGAFQEYAGTKVVTDIIILKKREKPISVLGNEGWIEAREHATKEGTKVWVNEYFHRNPSHVIGQIDFGHGTTTFRPGLIVHRPDDMMGELRRIVSLVPEGVFSAGAQAKAISYVANHTSDRTNSLVKTDKGFFVVRGEYLAPAHEVLSYKVKSESGTKQREAQLSALIDMRKQYGELVDAERAGDAASQRKALRDTYEAFKLQFGTLTDSWGLAYLERIDDPFYPALAALEIPSIEGGKTILKPASILRESTMRGAKKIEQPTVADAFVLARNETVNPSIERVAELAGKPAEKVKADLLAAGAVFELPNGDVEPSDLYLSGNVRAKLRDAQAALDAGNAKMESNVAALKEVVPADVPYYKIETQFGATWAPGKVYEQYVAHMLSMGSTEGVTVQFKNGSWHVDLDPKLNNRTEANSGFGTSHVRFKRLVRAAIANQSITVKYKDRDGNEYVDDDATKEVNAKIADMRLRFGEWLWKDPTRRTQLEREYNEVRNAYATPKFDGSFLSFQGMALSLGRGPFNLRQHQVNAIWRALVSRKSLNAHEVGTGKTFTMGGIAVESRRYGIAKKPMLFAHNANSKSVAHEIQMMYPAAKVLYLDNLSKDSINIRLMQIANDDWDVVVLPHSLIDRIGFKRETLEAMAKEDILSLEIAAEEAAAEDNVQIAKDMWDDESELKKLRSPTAKALVKQRMKIKAEIDKLAQQAAREGAVSFEDLGVDMIMVDEAHEFKKPPIATKMKMKGLQTQTSNRSIAMMFLTRYVRSMNGGANVHLFTGTPITNTMTEVFHMMRYMMQEEMDAQAVGDFDGWFGSFAREVSDVELTTTGEYEAVTRLQSFINVPELRRMIGQYMDVVFAEDMPEMQPRVVNGKRLSDKALSEADRAEILNGRTEPTSDNPAGATDRPYKKVVNESADMSPEQLRVFAQVQAWANSWRNMTKKQRKEAMSSGAPESPIIHDSIAARASFDVRLVESRANAGKEGTPEMAPHPDSKPARVVAKLLEVYKSHKNAGQAVFMEQGLSSTVSRMEGPKGARRAVNYPGFSTVKDMIERLVQQGIPREQIAVVDGSTSKDKRKEVADAMNEGRIRIVFGSSDSLGVGVNMQRNLRAMHHMDAPWMPGELEQRNGRGHRQGNQWNTVMEFRYLTDRLDGRRWQVLAIKQKFITDFMKSKGDARVIEGDAASDEGSDILSTFSEAAGDPRILMREKMKKKLAQLQSRERIHGQGIADALETKERAIGYVRKGQGELDTLKSSGLVNKLRDLIGAQAGEGFRVEVDGKTFASRQEAVDALPDWLKTNMRVNEPDRVIGKYGDFDLYAYWPTFSNSPALVLNVAGKRIESNGASLRSLEAQVRSVADNAEADIQGRISNYERSITQADRVAAEPFHLADQLKKAAADLAALERDIDLNPVAPPHWLRAGAPVETDVVWKGKNLTVTGHRWSDDGWFVLAQDSKGAAVIPYMEAQDSQGMPLYEEHEFTPPTLVSSNAPTGGSAAPAGPDAPAAKFSRNRSGGGVTMRDARAAVGLIRRELPSAPEIIVLESLSQAPDRLQNDVRNAGAERDWEAAYHDGKIYVMPDHIEDMDRFMFVVGRHEVRHAGFESMLGDQKDSILLSIGRANRRVMREAKQKMDDGLAKSEVVAIEEALADMPVEDIAALTRIKVLVAAVRRWLRSTAFKLRKAGWRALADSIEPKTWTDNDVIAFVFKAEDVSRGPGGGGGGGVRFSRATEGAKTVTNDEGHAEFIFDDTKLAFPIPTERIEVIPVKGQTVMQYAIMPTEGFDVLGHVDLLLENGKPVSLLDIEAYKRGNGVGRKTIETLLRANPGADLNISNIVPEAQGFWESMGVPVQNLEEGAAYDGTLNLETYLQAQDGQAAQGNARRPGSQGGSLDARAKGRAPEKDQGRQVSTRFSRAQTENANFKRWFGDSKVVDTEGKPLVVYHGSKTDTGPKFDPAKSRIAGAFFFAADPQFASSPAYTGYEGQAGNVSPVYLSLQNPKVLDSLSSNPMTEAAVIEAAKANGFDGIVVKKDGRFIAFRPEQIKSATGNNGQFSTKNSDTRFSRPRALSTLREAGARKAEAVRDANLFAGYKVGDFVSSTGTLSWWDKSIGTPFNLAKRHPDTFGRVFNAVQDFLTDVSFYATESANLAPKLLPKLDTLKDLTKQAISPEDSKAIAAPIFEGTLNWTRDDKGRPVRIEAGDEKAKPGIVFTPDELRSIFKLTQAQAALYKEFRASVDRSLDDLTVSEITRLVRSELPGAIQGEGQSPQAFADEIQQALIDIGSDDTAGRVAKMAERLTELKANGYAPLSRFGHHTLDVVDADGERVYFGLFESQAEANKKARQMRAEFPKATVTQGTQSQEAYKMLAGVSPETIELFGEILGLDATGDKESDKAFQEYLKKAKSTRSAMKRLIHRKGIAGFSEDAGRVLAGFITSNARRTASNHRLKDVLDSVQDMPKEQGELKDYAAKMAEYVNNPIEEAQALRGLMFVQYLGGSIASALVNMTQPIAVTMPYLSQHTSAANAAKLVTGALADMAGRKKLEGTLEEALKLAEEKGIVAPQEIHYLQAQAQGAGSLVSGDGTAAGDAIAKVKNGYSRLMVGWGKLFGFAELVNRRATFIASYRLAVQNKYPNPFQFATDAVNETQFVYNKGNRPQWARGAIGATLFTFKTYSISYVELLSRMWKLGGPEGKKAFMFAIATMILMSGVDELPFMEDVEDVIDGFAQRVLGLNWQTKAKRNEWAAKILGEDLAHFLAKGVSGVPGVPLDVSGRLGMGNLWPGTGLFRKDSQDPARDVAEIAGPVGDLLKRGFTAAGMAASGEVTKAALEISPVAIRNVGKAVDMGETGMYRDATGKKVIETTTGEAWLKGIGFQPNTVARVQDANFTKTRMIGLNKRVESEIADLWALGRFEDDPAKVESARNRLKEWNRQNPDSPIRIQQGQIQKRVRAMMMTKDERIAKTAPKEI